MKDYIGNIEQCKIFLVIKFRSKKREEEKKRSDTEIMKNAPTTTANNYLARLKNLYASTSESPRNDRFAKTMRYYRII